MSLSEQRVALTLFMLLSITQQVVLSQTKGIIVDKVTHQPIPYVSIYTKDGDAIHGAMSNEQGGFLLDFTFKTLFFSHINYEKVEIQKVNVRDTIYLTPTSVLLGEIVVSNKEPRWIPRILKEIVKQKSRNYQTSVKQFAYHYESYTLNDSNGYAFDSKGNVKVPLLSERNKYYIDAQHNIIRYKDKTAGVDFTNLKAMLHQDFISSFDNQFIRENTFKQNALFKTSNPLLVQIMFQDKKFTNTNGYILVDTLNNVIEESDLNCDTQYNLKHNTTLFFKVVAPNIGIKNDAWVTKSHTNYTKKGNSYYISESKYKSSMKSSQQNKKVNTHYFSSIESKVQLNDPVTSESRSWIPLLKPYYLITIMTKQMQRDEASLNKVPVKYEPF